ncbi:unnamed protein product, partial [Notodromas monacha]
MASFAVSVLLVLLVVHPDASSGRCHVQDGRLHCSEACDADAVRASEFDGRIVLTGHVLDFGCLDFFGIKKVELLSPTRCEGNFRPSLVDPVDFCVTRRVTVDLQTSSPHPPSVPSSSTGIPVTPEGLVILTTATLPTSLSTEATSVVTHGGIVSTQDSSTDSSVRVRLLTTHIVPETTKQTTPAPTTSKPSIIVSVLKNLPETRIHSGEHANVTLTVVEGKAVLGAEFATELFSNWAIGLISGLGVTVFGLAAGWMAWCLRKKWSWRDGVWFGCWVDGLVFEKK